MKLLLPAKWQAALENEFSLPYMEKIREFLRDQYRRQVAIFPPKDKIFRALQLCDLDDIRVVILGQDPYHNQGQANGLAFAVSQGVPLPPSLVNIFKEVSVDIKCPSPKNSELTGWAAQGVLLLNTLLTVTAHQPLSHKNIGWITFTDRVISILNAQPNPIVFLLWGSPSAAKASLINNKNHLVLKSPHPSPLSAHRGFFNSRPFSKANEFLLQHYNKGIDWSQS